MTEATIESINRVSRAAVLTDRDYAIIRRIARGQVLALTQAHKLFWVKAGDGSTLANISTARYRLSQLVGSGYLETDFTNARAHHAGEQVYWLTEAGLGLLTQLERDRSTPGKPPSNKMREQLDAQDARAKLETLLTAQGARLVDWRSERELRSEWGLRVRELERGLGRFLLSEELDELGEIADGQAVVDKVGTDESYRLDVEVDGAYTGKYLERKIAGLMRLHKATGNLIVYATSGGPVRIARLKRDIKEAKAQTFIAVLQI